MLVREARAGGFLRVNAAFQAIVGFSPAELAERPLADWISSDDQEGLAAGLRCGDGTFRVRHRTRGGDPLVLDMEIADSGGGPVVLARCAQGTPRAEVGAESEATVAGTLDTIARIVEEQNPGYRCSILLVEDGRFVRGAGPSLPEEYNAAIDGFAIGPTVGSCGTAIYWNTQVVVDDIQADPLWAPFAALAKKAGVAACWSHPFVSSTGRVLGALALYSPVPRAPTPEQLGRLRAAARMTGLAVERGRAEETLREQRKRERELEGKLRQAEKMEALGVLAGGVAHDFNNVLAAILANAEFALEVLPPDAAAAEMLTEIVFASRRAGGFCEQLLAYAGRRAIATKRFEVSTMAKEVTSLVGAALPSKVRLDFDLDEGAGSVDGDENQLLQVVMNLVRNAADAIGETEGRIVVATSVARHEGAELRRLAPEANLSAGDYVRLSVRDNGCGMNEETMKRVFDPFFTTKSGGHGLGLAAAKGIVLNHGGALLLESEVGVGTTFSILLPSSARGEPRASLKAPGAGPASGGGSPRHILIVDDEDSLRRILARRLKRDGYAVTEAADGDQAIKTIVEAPDRFDCVLLDLSMPKRGGEEVFRELRAHRKDVPVVVMSGYAEQEVIARFQGDNLVCALQKPVAAADLAETIRAAFSKTRAAGRRDAASPAAAGVPPP